MTPRQLKNSYIVMCREHTSDQNKSYLDLWLARSLTGDYPLLTKVLVSLVAACFITNLVIVMLIGM